MKIFTCNNCGNTIYFDNRVCINCNTNLGFVPDIQDLGAVVPVGQDLWQTKGDTLHTYRFCENASLDICNWLIPAEDFSPYCRACRYNRTVPSAANSETLEHWRRIGAAQRHLFYSTIRWDLPMPGRDIDPEGGLVFDFLEDEHQPDGSCKHAMTGQDEGIITIRAAEADDSVREGLRTQLHEPYRTLLGHFRHETGHFIWNHLVRDAGNLAACRAVFGDDSQSYDEAIAAHYKNGPPPGWENDFISAYATMHPWEDFAETFAHCFHIVDALETSWCLNLRAQNSPRDPVSIDFDPYLELDFERMAEAWVPLSLSLNSIHHSMGERPLYPFILTPVVRKKLSFVHRIITRQAV